MLIHDQPQWDSSGQALCPEDQRPAQPDEGTVPKRGRPKETLWESESEVNSDCVVGVWEDQTGRWVLEVPAIHLETHKSNLESVYKSKYCVLLLALCVTVYSDTEAGEEEGALLA